MWSKTINMLCQYLRILLEAATVTKSYKKLTAEFGILERTVIFLFSARLTQQPFSLYKVNLSQTKLTPSDNGMSFLSIFTGKLTHYFYMTQQAIQVDPLMESNCTHARTITIRVVAFPTTKKIMNKR